MTTKIPTFNISAESLFKTNLGSSIAKIFEYDYKMDGHKHIICVTVEGVVTGFILKHEDIKTDKESKKKRVGNSRPFF